MNLKELGKIGENSASKVLNFFDTRSPSFLLNVSYKQKKSVIRPLAINLTREDFTSGFIQQQHKAKHSEKCCQRE